MNDPSQPTHETETGIPLRPYRIVLAMLLSPWAAPGVIIAGATMAARRWPFNFDLPHLASMGVLPAYAGMLLIGLPFFNYLRKSHRLDLVRLTASGALGGSLFLLIVVSIFSRTLGEASISIREIVLDVGWGTLLGAAVAIAFALIAGVPVWIRTHPRVPSTP